MNIINTNAALDEKYAYWMGKQNSRGAGQQCF